jgi:ABC-2 type transport system permease protein
MAKTLRDQRMQIAGYGLALAAIAALDVFIWPSYRNTFINFEVPPALEALFGGELNLATGAGFLSAEFYSWVNILLLVFAIMQGSGAIAGEESSGTMELMLAQPVSRRSLVLQKAAAGVVAVAIIVGIGYLGWLVSIPFVDINVTLWDVFLANVNLLPITMFFFALALCAGVIAPSRGVAVAAVVAFAVISYFAQTIAATIEWLSWLDYLTPFYYYGAGKPLVDGLNFAHIGLLLGLATLLVVVALRVYDQRDVSVGGTSDLGVGGVVRRLLAVRTGV